MEKYTDATLKGEGNVGLSLFAFDNVVSLD